MKKIGYDQFKIDELRIVDDRKKCCLKVNAVITKVGVYQYPDGRAFKSRMELLKATRTARNAKITILDHPDSLVIMSQNQIYGIVEDPFFERDKIRATLNFDKYVTPPQFLTDIRSKKLHDVSIGFYYQPDYTPGVYKGKPYDYVMRDIVIDHVAAGVMKGRCTMPECGIGVDSLIKGPPKIGLDPFGEYTSFEDCVAKNQNKDNPEAYCAELHKKILGKYPQEDSKFFGNVNKNLKSHFRGEKQKMSENQPNAGETTPSEFDQCVSERIADGWNEKAAKDYCMAYTTTRDEPDIPANTQTPPSAPTGGASTSQKDQEEGAEPGEGETAEQTELEKCITNKTDEGLSREEAEAWCKAEQAGEHAPAADMIEHSQSLIQKYEHMKIEKQRAARRHPS